MPDEIRRFVQAKDVRKERDPWATVEWLSRPGLVQAEHLLMVRATIEARRSHPFHRHPHREEIIYVLKGRAEQWVEKEFRVLEPGEMAHIPMNTIHATFNPFGESVTFLAILGPAQAPPPDIVDVSEEEPWRSIRQLA